MQGAADEICQVVCSGSTHRRLNMHIKWVERTITLFYMPEETVCELNRNVAQQIFLFLQRFSKQTQEYRPRHLGAI